ncbi:Putative inositol monophosphatase 3 [Papilio xuthus]|uniref:inositol-phosphate phosphatase n=1 Tax=Papilio xuthus TaxID=66420 RepID=A0A194PUS7_PAPXU|nr:Putative inositol monophosphatase 3 [Papilio xuthus]
MNFSGTLRINKFACFTLLFILFVIIYWRSNGGAYPTDKNEIINLKTLLTAAIHAAEYGGSKVMEGTNRDLIIKSKGKTKEGVNDPVTDADQASHCVMFYGLSKTFPKLTIVSEEHSINDPKCEDQEPFNTDTPPPQHRMIENMNNELVFAKDITIWIDPLDATKEYTEGLYQYVTTMVCVAYKGIPIIGVIHYPFPPDNPQTYWGWLAKKTSSNIANVAYQVEYKENPRVVVSISHQGKVSDMARESFGPMTTVTTAAGAGYKVMGVVNGSYDVYLHATAIKKWDLCAGDAIIRTVDGKMTTAKGDYIDYSPDADVKVNEGVLVTRYNHDFYLSQISKNLNNKP